LSMKAVVSGSSPASSKSEQRAPAELYFAGA
jgi:hypothetical protein